MARFHLGLTDDEFFRLTPRQLRLLLNRHREATQHAELLHGIIAAAVVNSGFSAPKKGVEPRLFMPSQWGKRAEEAEPKRRIRRRDIAQNIRCFLTARAE